MDHRETPKQNEKRLSFDQRNYSILPLDTQQNDRLKTLVNNLIG